MSLLEQVKEIADFFKIPAPAVVIDPSLDVEGIFLPDSYTIIFKRPNPSPAVVAHEVAHAAHSYYGVKGSRSELESFARVFEGIWISMPREFAYGLYCPSCFRPFLLEFYGYQGKAIKCLNCYSEWRPGEMARFSCQICGATVSASGKHAVCPKCGTEYEAYEYPATMDELVPAAFGAAMLTAILGVAISGAYPATKEEVARPENVKKYVGMAVGLFAAAGFSGLLAAYLSKTS